MFRFGGTRLAGFLPRLRLLAGVGLLCLVAACGSGATSGGAPQQEVQPSPEAAAFPVTIEHKFGTTVVPSPPQRVVTVGFQAHDAVLALGVIPVGARGWEGDEFDLVFWPWAREALGDAKPEILSSGELNFEQIAGLRPDLIIATYSGIEDLVYDRLSQIAPTVAQPDTYTDYGMPWPEQTRLIGRALGASPRAEELIAGVEARFAQARQAHPEFQGKTAVFASPGEPGQYYAFGPKDSRTQFLDSLGFELPGEIAELAGDEFYVELSDERLALLEADMLVWHATGEVEQALGTNPLYQRLTVVRNGDDVFLGKDATAISFNSVLSLPYAIDELEPQFTAAVG